VLTTDDRRADLVDNVLDILPLSDSEGRDTVEGAVDSVRRISGPLAAGGLALALWTASSMFGAIRRSIDTIWRIEEHRPYVQAKLLDLAQVCIFILFLGGSVAATGFLRTVRELSTGRFGPLGDANLLWEVPALLLPAVLTFVMFVLLYRYVPPTKPRWRDTVAGALLASVLFEIMKNLFALYVANANNYDLVYGSLAGILLFLLNMYFAAAIILIGAECTRVFERYHAGELDPLIYPTGPRESLATQTLRAFKGLFVRQ
jgi:membrane protein